MASIDKFKLHAAVLLALGVTLGFGTQVRATPISVDGFAIKISANVDSFGGLSQALRNSLTLVAQDRPTISISNASTTSSITSFTLEMGNSVFAFGSLLMGANNSPVVATSFLPTNLPGTHANSPTATVNFSGFAPGLFFEYRADLDRVADGGASLVDYKQALASTGNPNNWATAIVTFSDGTVLTQKLSPTNISGAAQNPTYSYFYCLKNIPASGEINVQSSQPVPEPGTWLLAALGSSGLALAAVRRRVREQRAA
jgi:hypothetical protein